MTESTKIHGNTKKAADISLARKDISRESHGAVHEGRISLEEARELGRDAGPDAPPTLKSTVSKSDRTRHCVACGPEGAPTKGGRFHPGCDAKMHSLAREYVRGERDLTPEQMAYVEESGKLEQARARVAKEQAKAVKKQNAGE